MLVAAAERLKVTALEWHSASKPSDEEAGLPPQTELVVGALAGGAAGGLTTPLGRWTRWQAVGVDGLMRCAGRCDQDDAADTARTAVGQP